MIDYVLGSRRYLAWISPEELAEKAKSKEEEEDNEPLYKFENSKDEDFEIIDD